MKISDLFRRQERIRAYCQVCGQELTEAGGKLANGKIYCADSGLSRKRCSDQAGLEITAQGVGVAGREKPRLILTALTAKEIQKAIRSGHLEHFSPKEDHVAEWSP